MNLSLPMSSSSGTQIVDTPQQQGASAPVAGRTFEPPSGYVNIRPLHSGIAPSRARMATAGKGFYPMPMRPCPPRLTEETVCDAIDLVLDDDSFIVSSMTREHGVQAANVLVTLQNGNATTEIMQAIEGVLDARQLAEAIVRLVQRHEYGFSY